MTAAVLFWNKISFYEQETLNHGKNFNKLKPTATVHNTHILGFKKTKSVFKQNRD